MSDKIRILFLAANPINISHLRLDEEAREIEQHIELGSARDRFELIQQWAVRTTDLQRALLKYKPHIVHFSGHGSLDEEIILEDYSGRSKQIGRQAIADLFRILKDDVRIVVLNSCLTKAQAEALKDNIDYTVGTKKAVGDRAAVTFASAFYLALAFGRSVNDAFASAKLELKLCNIPGAEAPELFIREGVDAREPFIIQKDAIDRRRA
jgi:CHAT domain-containing protein